MRARQSVLGSLCCSILAISAACSDAANPVLSLDGPVALQPVTSVVVTPSQATLPIGSSVSMKLSMGKANGQPVMGAVRWTSSDTTVATVSASGEVVARAAGDAVIMASVGAAHAVATVEVPAADVSASDSAGPATSPSDTSATSASSTPDSASSTP